MINEVKQIYLKLLRIGLAKDAPFKEKLRVELSNQFIFAGLLCVLFHNVANLLFLKSFVDFCLTMVWFMVLGPSLLLNLLEKPIAARWFLTLGGTLAVFTLHILFGPHLKLESMYILFLVVAALFFEFSTIIKFALMIICSLLLATFICSYTNPIYEHLINPAGAFTRFIFSVTMIVLLIGKLLLENRRYNAVIVSQNEHLKDYNQQLKSFNYIVSHDLKEPLRIIVGFSQLLKINADKGRTLKEEYLNHVIQSTKQLNNLVDDLKTFTDSSEKEITKEVIKIDELVGDIKLALAEIIRAKNVQIICTSFPPIRSSKIALTIILRNLIENGIKYNDKEQPEIIIDGAIQEGMAKINICDNGIGIEKEYYQYVFEMFKRLNADYKKGSGLGLNITRNLIKRLKGEISIVASEVNKGTTFQITFPIEMVETSAPVEDESKPG